MADAPRITATDLKRRIDAGEDFTVIDTRNPHAWAESGEKAAGALRIPLDEAEAYLDRIPKDKAVVAYCT
jgi:rhodanese-related sulfurtransferase